MDPFVEARIVKDTWVDVNKMVGLEGNDAIRGLGHTAHQIREAPENAYFVWCTEDRSYPTQLARHLGRTDLLMRTAMWLFKEASYTSHRAPIVVDHAYKPPKFR